ncbi:hypothetical protein MPH_10614 [Macrophomina phaseolina MS6]|uniref:Uncharacterized protein n=1 Tax=Macrophomina phaseolina (strain MS6) TaxID=1126212 RepID=K2RQ18_MACPH|nr:hypothetical protein MPH_10614 [Macrophomina phaseolina MS6]
MAPKEHHQYMTVSDLNNEHYTIAWYWRLIALLASWMILGGYLIIPPLFHENAESELRCAPRILTVFVVALLVAGYSFTVLLCFAVKSMIFQSESIFLPALASSALGLLTVLYNWLAYAHFEWNRASIIAIALSGGMTLLYGIFLVHTNRRITRLRAHLSSRSHNMWQHNSTYYENWIANMFPSVKHVSPDYSAPPDQYNMPPTDDDLVNQQMAMLLMNKDPGPSPDASQSTFQIQLPIGEESDTENSPNARRNRTVRSPPRTLPVQEFYGIPRTRTGSHGHGQSSSDPRRGRTDARGGGGEVRAKSREERRQEIEMGLVR